MTLSIVSVPTGADRGAVDVSIEMLFGTVVALLVMLLIATIIIDAKDQRTIIVLMSLLTVPTEKKQDPVRMGN